MRIDVRPPILIPSGPYIFPINGALGNSTISGSNGTVTAGADAYPALQAASDAAALLVGSPTQIDSAARPVIFVPPGIYALSSKWTIKHGVSLSAQGAIFVDNRALASKGTALIQIGEPGGTSSRTSMTSYLGYFSVIDDLDSDPARWDVSTTMTTDSDTTIVVASATQIKVGQLCVGVGIPLETRVTAVNGTTITLDKAATTTAGPGTAVTFSSDLWAGIEFVDVIDFVAEIGMTRGHFSGVLMRPDSDGVAWGTINHRHSVNHRRDVQIYPRDTSASYVNQIEYKLQQTRSYSNGYSASADCVRNAFWFTSPIGNGKRYSNWVIQQPNFEHATNANAGVDRTAIVVTAFDTSTAGKQTELNVRMNAARQEYTTSASYVAKVSTNCWLHDDSVLDLHYHDYTAAMPVPSISNSGLPTRAELRHPAMSRTRPGAVLIDNLAKRIAPTTTFGQFGVKGMSVATGTENRITSGSIGKYRRRYLELTSTSVGLSFIVNTDQCKFWNIFREIQGGTLGGVVAITCFDDVQGLGSVLSGGADWDAEYCKHPIGMGGNINSRKRLTQSGTFGNCYKAISNINESDRVIPILVSAAVKSIMVTFCAGTGNAKLRSVGIEVADPNFHGSIEKHVANGAAVTDGLAKVGLSQDLRWTNTTGATILTGGEFHLGERLWVSSSGGKSGLVCTTAGFIGTVWGASTLVADDVVMTSTNLVYECVTGGTIDATEASDTTGSNFTAPGTGTAILKYIGPKAVVASGAFA